MTLFGGVTAIFVLIIIFMQKTVEIEPSAQRWRKHLKRFISLLLTIIG